MALQEVRNSKEISIKYLFNALIISPPKFYIIYYGNIVSKVQTLETVNEVRIYFRKNI